MSTLFTASLLGRAGADASVVTAASGTRVANVSLAHDLYAAGNRSTMWTKVIAFGGNADRLAKVQKGQRVHIDGDLRSRKWQDKEGVERVTMELVAQRITYVDFAPKVETPSDDAETSTQPESEITPDDIP